jgi:hypothetical protein
MWIVKPGVHAFWLYVVYAVALTAGAAMSFGRGEMELAIFCTAGAVLCCMGIPWAKQRERRNL